MDAGSEVVVRGVSESSIGLVTATRQELVAGSQDTIRDWYRAKWRARYRPMHLCKTTFLKPSQSGDV